MINAIALDDEPIALDVIRTHAAKIPFLNLQAVFVSPADALAFIRANTVDLLFLDIRMPDISGVEFAALIPKNIQVVFTTAYQEHALQGFELAAADYLLKPISLSRLLQACNLVSGRIAKQNNQPENSNSLFVKDGYDLVRIDLSRVTYVEAGDNYLSIYEGEKRTLTRMTLAELLRKLPASNFQRVHKSYIVATDKIEKIERGHLFAGGIKIPVSANFREELMQKLEL